MSQSYTSCRGPKSEQRPERALVEEMQTLFEPLRLGHSLCLLNRLVMAPMTRRCSPHGVPGPDVAAYYRRRAEGGVGLIITEGAWVPHPCAAQYLEAVAQVPRFYGEDALSGWKLVVDEVHRAGGKIVPQLWHVGQSYHPEDAHLFVDDSACRERLFGPSGLVATHGGPLKARGVAASAAQIREVIDAYATAAKAAWRLGFDGIELHAAHGYLIDQFLWSETNRRTDEYGGDRRGRSRFAADILRAVRASTAPDFPIIIRISQWKMADYGARTAATPQELAEVLEPLVEAGADVFHCSQRRFWEGEFDSDLNLAGWAKKLTGKLSITVGSVGVDVDFINTLREGRGSGSAQWLGELERRLARGDFDLVAVGRALVANPDWPRKLRDGSLTDVKPYSPAMLAELD